MKPFIISQAASWSVIQLYIVRRDELFARIRDARELPSLLLHMTAFSAFFSSVYGLSIGLYAGGQQIVYNIVKLPLLLLATLALCVLALYMLQSLMGARLTFSQTTAIVLSAILVTSCLLCALTPPLCFIMLTSLESYTFIVFLNLLVICLAGAGGVSFALQATKAVHTDAILRLRALKLMRAWMFLYGLVGLQILWLFRPYFRATDVFIRPLGEGGNAFDAFGRLVLNLIRSLL